MKKFWYFYPEGRTVQKANFENYFIFIFLSPNNRSRTIRVDTKLKNETLLLFHQTSIWSNKLKILIRGGGGQKASFVNTLKNCGISTAKKIKSLCWITKKGIFRPLGRGSPQTPQNSLQTESGDDP